MIFTELDIRPLLRGEVSSISVDFTLDFNDIDDVKIKGPVKVRGKIDDNAGYMRMRLEVGFDYVGECARCLDPVEGTFKSEVERTVVTEGALTKEQEEENIDEYVIACKGFVNVDEQIEETVLFDFPKKLLCSEDCPGLCPKCGKKLRDGACSCPKKDPDPRWSALADLLDKDDKK